MTQSLAQRLFRVRRWLLGADALRDPHHPLGLRARAELPELTGLSPANVKWALEHAFESRATDDEIVSLCGSTPEASRAVVVLSAHVFVGALRAIAIGLASSETVIVRPSRREPKTVELLSLAAPGIFQRTATLAPRRGDHVWVYGRDQTLSRIAGTLPQGVTLHGHGTGFGLVVLQPAEEQSMAGWASAVARDTMPFDQRGCLSPRLVFVLGSLASARGFAQMLAEALGEGEQRIPVGRLAPDELAARVRHRDLATYAGEWYPAGSGGVSLDTTGRFRALPPIGRVLHVIPVADLASALSEIRPFVTTVALAGDPRVADELAVLCPGARLVPLGRMQSPPLDGPVDRRESTPRNGGPLSTNRTEP